MAAVRHAWMFRTAAVVFLFFGAVFVWRYGFTEFHPEQRPIGLLIGILALGVGVFLMRLKRFAIGVSAIVMALVGLSSAVFAPEANGPVILFLAALAVICVVYAVLALRFLTHSVGSKSP
ncbi:MAG: hypothetical protein K0Q92_2224 [Steroidobacteraceae bacterium]|jgi:hypothetical protein|nr:hypothetical protein [Steroidobacteraceae bacterium]